MTPKAKAIDIVDKMYQLFPAESNVITSNGDLTWEYDCWDQAKKAALIAVEEIIEVAYWNSVKNFYKEVKTEIENL